MSMDIGKVKRSGVEARHSLQLDGAGSQASDEGKWLECVVIEEQPLVWIKKTSLTHGTVMLYHGERSVGCSTYQVLGQVLTIQLGHSLDIGELVAHPRRPHQAVIRRFDRARGASGDCRWRAIP